MRGHKTGLALAMCVCAWDGLGDIVGCGPGRRKAFLWGACACSRQYALGKRRCIVIGDKSLLSVSFLLL